MRWHLHLLQLKILRDEFSFGEEMGIDSFRKVVRTSLIMPHSLARDPNQHPY